MAKKHDRAARLTAKKLDGSYDPTDSPDVKGKLGRAEVKSTAYEISKAREQLSKRPGKAYVVLPKVEHGKARAKLEGSGIGIIDYKGKITKRSKSTRKNS